MIHRKWDIACETLCCFSRAPNRRQAFWKTIQKSVCVWSFANFFSVGTDWLQDSKSAKKKEREREQRKAKKKEREREAVCVYFNIRPRQLH